MTSLLCRVPQSLALIRAAAKVTATAGRVQPLSLTSVNRLKEIRHSEKDGKVVIEGVYVKSPREDYLIHPPAATAEVAVGKAVVTVGTDCKTSCPLCRLGPLAYQIKHTDVLILNQFVRPDGNVLSRRITGLCKVQQKRVTWLVQMAKGAGLMVNTEPNYAWKHFNKYYNEEVIEDFLTGRAMRA